MIVVLYPFHLVEADVLGLLILFYYVFPVVFLKNCLVGEMLINIANSALNQIVLKSSGITNK